MNKLVTLFIVLALMAMTVSATNVECGWGNYPPCNEQEVQDAVDELDDDIDDLQGQINDIELTPGPQGEQGVQGEKGDKGDTGADGQDGVDGKDGKDGKNANPIVEIIQNIAIAHNAHDINHLERDVNNLEDDVEQNSDDILAVNARIAAGASAWSEDRKGWGRTKVLSYLYDEFTDFLRTMFVPRSEYDAQSDYIEGLKMVSGASMTEIDLAAMQARAWRTGEIVYYNDFICKPNGVECVHN